MKRPQDTVRVKTQFLEISTEEKPFQFSDGQKLHPIVVAYTTHGRLNEKKTNAILVFHALSGSQNVAGFDEEGPGNDLWTKDCQLGWWDAFVGPGKGIDTDKYFVICCNYLGGCYGSSGPSSVNPSTGKPFASAFPYPTVSDIVDSNIHILDHYGIQTLLSVMGGSMGGFCALDLACRYPRRVQCVVPIATGVRATVLAKALNFEQIYAIEEDRNFNGGEYYDSEPPTSGLTLARMISHKTFVSLSLMESRARKTIVQPDDYLSGYSLKHQIESYILHQGRKFVKRFDANSYLRIVNTWQSFDLPQQLAGGDIRKTFSRCHSQDWLIFSINSDVCFYPDEQIEIAEALKANQIDYQHITVHSEKGHDSFLLEPDLYIPYINYKLENAHTELEQRGDSDLQVKNDKDFTI